MSFDPGRAARVAVAVAARDRLHRTSSEFRAYVPASRQLPEVVLRPHRDPDWFPVGVKHRYVRLS